MQRRYLMHENRSLIERGDYFLATVIIAADLETFLAEKLFFEKDMPYKKVAMKSLGWCIKECYELGLISESDNNKLLLFLEIRNRMVHTRNYRISAAILNPEKRKIIRESLIFVCDYLDSNVISYKHNQKKESEYQEWGDSNFSKQH